MKTKLVIRTNFACPPIPVRGADWEAVTDDYEGGDPVGRGATEQEAVDDLIERLELDEPVMYVIIRS